MPPIRDLKVPARRAMHVFFVLDTSGSMANAKISALNHGVEEAVNALKEVAKSNGDAKLYVAMMEFNTGCRWVTSNGPEDLEKDFEYEYLEAGGLTDIGAALKELNSKLSQHAFLQSMTGAYMPVIIFMTDGYATDNYEKALEEIRENKWFARATKIGIAFGDDADVKMISSVVGNSEAVIWTNDLDQFKRLLKFVSVTTTIRNSKPAAGATTATGADIVNEAKESGIISDESTVSLGIKEYNPEPAPPEDGTWDDETWDDGTW